MRKQKNRQPPLLRRVAALLLGLGTLPSLATSQERNTSATTELLLAGDPVVVTASRRVQRASEVSAAVTVFTEEDIRAMRATSLLDILRYAPGLEVAEFNRSVANVSIRGFNDVNANKLLVMVDGRSIYQDYTGSVLWAMEPILITRIKRIEIVRGPGSALYGANAFNGVINIITKTPQEIASSPAKTTVRSQLGEQATTFNEIVTGDKIGRDWYFSLGAGYSRTDGFGERKAGNSRDSYLRPTIALDLQKHLPRGSAQIALGNAEATADYNTGISFNDARWHTSYLVASYTEEGVKNPMTARFFGNFNLFTAGGMQQVDAQTLDFEWQKQHSLSAQHNLVYGINYRNTRLGAAIIGTNTRQQEVFALYLQDEAALSKQTRLTAGLRLDQNSLYGFNATPRVSLLHNLPQDQTLRFALSTSFRNPTLVDNYLDLQSEVLPGLFRRVKGNLNLEAESVTSFEMGYRKNLPQGYVGINAFYNRQCNLIGFVPTTFAPPQAGLPPGFATELTTMNTGGAHALGLELETQLRFDSRNRLLFNYAYQDTQGAIGQPISLSPQHKVNVSLHSQLTPRVDSFLGLHYVGPSVAVTSTGIASLSDYVRVDAFVGYRFGSPERPLTISLGATNLFDSKHEEYSFLGVPNTSQRRTFYLMLDGKF